MKKIELQNEEFFTYCENENDLVSSGELAGTYILCKQYKRSLFNI
jgi:hypothetical protein